MIKFTTEFTTEKLSFGYILIHLKDMNMKITYMLKIFEKEISMGL